MRLNKQDVLTPCSLMTDNSEGQSLKISIYCGKLGVTACTADCECAKHGATKKGVSEEQFILQPSVFDTDALCQNRAAVKG